MTCDYSIHRIPNFLILLGMAAGVILTTMQRGILMGTISYAISFGLILIILYPLFKLGAVGAGDVKLFSVTAGYLTIKDSLIFLSLAFILGAIFAIIKMLRCHNFRERIQYFLSYTADLLQTGKITLYWKNADYEGEYSSCGICMAGPAFWGLLLMVTARRLV